MGMREKVKKRAEQNKNKGAASLFRVPDGTDFFKAKDKTFNLDLIPYRVSVDTHPEVSKGDVWFERTIFVHYGVGSEEKSRLCPRTVKLPCPICNERKELMQEGDEKNDDLIAQLKPKERVLYNVIDLDNQDKGTQLWDFSYFCFGKQLDEEIREGSEDLADFAELKGGKTLKVRFSEESAGKNKYVKATRIDFKTRKDYPPSILDEVIDLDKILVILDYDELEKELHGVDTEKTGESEEKSPEEKPEPEKKTRRTKEPEPEPEEDSVAKERERRRAQRAGEKLNDPCPHGHQFGKDTDKHPECDDCKVWVECDDAKEQSK